MVTVITKLSVVKVEERVASIKLATMGIMDKLTREQKKHLSHLLKAECGEDGNDFSRVEDRNGRHGIRSPVCVPTYSPSNAGSPSSASSGEGTRCTVLGKVHSHQPNEELVGQQQPPWRKPQTLAVLDQ